MLEIKRFLSLMALSAFLLALLTASCSRPPRPNVVVIVIDTLRTDHLSFHGYARDTTPFLSTLALRSADFTRAYAGSSWTAPATASIFTGLYPFQHGVVMRPAIPISTRFFSPAFRFASPTDIVRRFTGEVKPGAGRGSGLIAAARGGPGPQFTRKSRREAVIGN